jgi:Fe-S cluster assembly scaffold protein SufB
MSTVTLSGVDATPTQTWNRLRVNDTTLEVPAPASSKREVVLDGRVARVSCGAGPEATAWLDAMAPRARLIEVPARTTAHLELRMDATTPVRSCGIIVGEGATVHVTVVAADAQASKTFGSQLRLVLSARAHVDVTSVVALGERDQYLDSLGATLGTGAHLDVTQYLLGAGTSALGSLADLAGDASSARLTMRYLADEAHSVDFGQQVWQRGHDTRAHIEASGVVGEHAAKSSRQTIDLRHGCKGSRGQESEVVVLAGEDVSNRSLPTILCDEEDVAADHGATIGTIAGEQLSYLVARGLTRADAAALVRESLVRRAADKTHGPAREAVVRFAGTLDADLAADLVPATSAAGEATRS